MWQVILHKMFLWCKIVCQGIYGVSTIFIVNTCMIITLFYCHFIILNCLKFYVYFWTQDNSFCTYKLSIIHSCVRCHKNTCVLKSTLVPCRRLHFTPFIIFALFLFYFTCFTLFNIHFGGFSLASLKCKLMYTCMSRIEY